jgi:phosphatidylglycerophosphatase A
MDFSKGFNIQLATLFGIGKIPGGGTWASLAVLLIALYEQNAETASFLAFFTLIIGPRAYKRLIDNMY